MRAWLFAGLVVLASGCSRFDNSKAYRFACTRDAGDSECPGGWKCGVDGVCLDPAVPASHHCVVTSDCTGGWVCALEGVCLDPSVGGSHPCAVEGDCTGGWHCGKGGVCYDRRTATDVACRSAVPTDCAPGWRCGLEAVCHDQDAGAAYECANDSDCERGWRCDVSQVCVDVAGDALRPTAGFPTVTSLQQVGPRGKAPLAFATGPGEEIHSVCGFSSERRSLAMVTAQGLLEKVVTYEGSGRVSQCNDAGFPVVTTMADRATLPWDAGTPALLLETAGATFVVTAQGEFQMYSFRQPNTLFRESVTGMLPFLPKGMRWGSGVFDPFLVAFDDTRVALFNAQTKTWLGTVAPRLDPRDGGQLATINDAMWLGDACDQLDRDCMTNSPSQHQLVLATSRGIFAVPATDVSATSLPRSADFSPISMPRADCWEVEVLRLLKPHRESRDLLAVIRRGLVGSPEWVLIPSTNHLPMYSMACPYLTFDDGSSAMTYADSASGFSDSYYACGGNPTGRQFRGITAFRGSRGVEFESLCSGPDGGGADELFVQWSNFTQSGTGEYDDPRTPQRSDAGIFLSMPHPQARAIADGHGRMWWSPEDSVELAPIFPQGVPEVIGGGQQGVFGVQVEGVPRYEGQPKLMGSYFLRQPFGFVNVGREALAQLASSAVGKPEWVALSDPDEDNAALVLEVTGPSLFGFRGVARVAALQGTVPFLSAAAPLANGATLYMLSGFDTVHAVEVRRTIGFEDLVNSPDIGALLPPASPVLVPLPQRAVTSLLILGPNADAQTRARYMEGYLTTAGRVFRFRADNPVVWRHDEIELDGEGEIVKVFNDQKRVRAGYRDGKVYSLPSRTLVAPAITGNTSVVLDFADLCGNTFALTRSGLQRLTVTGSGLGTWEPVPLAAPSTAFINGKLHVAGTELIVWVEGEIFSVTATCAQ